MERTVEYAIKMEHWVLRIASYHHAGIVQLSLHWNDKPTTSYIKDIPLSDFEVMVKDLLEKK